MYALRVRSLDRCDCCDLYKPLAPNQARVVCIGSAQGGDDQGISLRTIDLDDAGATDSHQNYTAISYTWGDPSSHVALPICCASGGVHDVKVSHSIISLVAELRRLGIRDIWVDQLSINQDANLEKAAQISLMKK
jgi:hypothetical protein